MLLVLKLSNQGYMKLRTLRMMPLFSRMSHELVLLRAYLQKQAGQRFNRMMVLSNFILRARIIYQRILTTKPLENRDLEGCTLGTVIQIERNATEIVWDLR